MSLRITAIFARLRRSAAVLGLSLSLALGLPALASAQEIKFPLPKFHALSGVWWAKTLYDDSGAAIWHGGQDDQAVILRVDLSGQFSTRLDCNGLFGQFEETYEDGPVSLSSEGMMSTLIGCFGDYPPAIRFSDIARFEREDLELRFFDADDRPVAVLYNAYALQRVLADILGA